MKRRPGVRSPPRTNTTLSPGCCAAPASLPPPFLAGLPLLRLGGARSHRGVGPLCSPLHSFIIPPFFPSRVCFSSHPPLFSHSDSHAECARWLQNNLSACWELVPLLHRPTQDCGVFFPPTCRQVIRTKLQEKEKTHPLQFPQYFGPVC